MSAVLSVALHGALEEIASDAVRGLVSDLRFATTEAELKEIRGRLQRVLAVVLEADRLAGSLTAVMVHGERRKAPRRRLTDHESLMVDDAEALAERIHGGEPPTIGNGTYRGD